MNPKMKKISNAYKPKSEDNLIDDDAPKNEDDLKNENYPKMKTTSKTKVPKNMKTTSDYPKIKVILNHAAQAYLTTSHFYLTQVELFGNDFYF